MTNLWKELHEHAWSYKGTNDSLYIQSFENRIPKYHNCKCKEFWNAWIKSNPPTYGIDENGINKYFEWTVKTHNAVNQKLGKPIISLEEAIKMYA